MDRDGTSTSRNFARALAMVVLAAFALRMGLRAAAGTANYWQDGYEITWRIAQELTAGHGYSLPYSGPTAYRVPFYPLFLAAVTGGNDWPWAVVTAQALVSAGTVACAGLIARRLFGPCGGLVAAVICAVWPYYVWHDTALQETGLFTFLSAAATLALLKLREEGGKRLAFGAGGLLGLALLTRATILPFALFALGWLVWQGGRRGAVQAGWAALALALVTAPWLAWSVHVIGKPAFGTEFGAALYSGNHDLTFAAYPERSIDESRAMIFDALPPADQARLDTMSETAASDWYETRGRAWIAAHPGQFASGALRKLWAAFGPWPVPRHGLLADLAYAATWLPLLLLGLVGLWAERRKWRRDLLFTVQFAVFAGTSAVLWAQTSHRAPLDVLLMVFAAAAIVRNPLFARLPLPGRMCQGRW